MGYCDCGAIWLEANGGQIISTLAINATFMPFTIEPVGLIFIIDGDRPAQVQFGTRGIPSESWAIRKYHKEPEKY